jgi:hypothetical protein
MRTLIILGIAATAVVAAERAAAAEVPMAQGISIADTLVAAGHKKNRDANLDYGTGYPGDARVYSGGADRYPVEGEYRRVQDTDYQGRWTGTWDGTYEAPDGRVYEGQYEGTYEGQAGTSYAPPRHGDPYADGYRTGQDQRYAYPQGGYDPREDARMARLCNDSGIGGAAIGAIAGGIAGNRIAGRGNRLGGTLIGAGVGGLVGGVIDHSEDRARCKAWRASRQRHSEGSYPVSYPAPGGYPAHGSYPAPSPYPYPGAPHVSTYHQGGYGYYSPGVVVTTIITQAAPVVTETVTTTTTTHYETVHVPRARHVAKKRVYKPRPKPRCGC